MHRTGSVLLLLLLGLAALLWGAEAFFVSPSSCLLNQRHQQQITSTPARASGIPMSMAGFGKEGAQDKKKSIGSGAGVVRKQDEAYVALQKAGETPAKVFVRKAGGEEGGWQHVADVIADKGQVEPAIQGQKRLILEHAQQVNVAFKAPDARNSLELGYEPAGEGTEVVPMSSKISYNGEKVGVRLVIADGASFYKESDPYGLAGRIDTSSKANVVKSIEK